MYTEKGVASKNHQCSGSIGVEILTINDERVSIQDIFYCDKGHEQGEYKNKPHWNREERIIDIRGDEKKVPSKIDHIIGDSEFIKLSCIDSYGNKCTQTVNKE